MTAYFLAAQPSTLGLGTGLEAPFLPPLPSLRKLILCCQCAFCSSPLLNALEAQPPGQREPALGRWVVIQSQAILEEAIFYWPSGASFLLLSSLICSYRKILKSEEKCLVACCRNLTDEAGGQEGKLSWQRCIKIAGVCVEGKQMFTFAPCITYW